MTTIIIPQLYHSHTSTIYHNQIIHLNDVAKTYLTTRLKRIHCQKSESGSVLIEGVTGKGVIPPPPREKCLLPQKCKTTTSTRYISVKEVMGGL